MRVVGIRGKGKYFVEYAILIKKLCFKLYGFGYFFASPKIKRVVEFYICYLIKGGK